ncbi:hypothetical protein M407DRAFT_26119 [Tulasnella calospora MUT 4182]|uniref:C2H2-type domain-containing protein n=1 Tax=Tulasnella calospora MUT 4182 TaxID=1051891 RepID=A0A0C3QGB7_9AGAM|nr:hypothetical protein M407DRAFT_26119 [Tulasnella calospora MUT 4182]
MSVSSCHQCGKTLASPAGLRRHINSHKVNITNANVGGAFWTQRDARGAVLVTQDRLVAWLRIAATGVIEKTLLSNTYDVGTQISRTIKL